MKKLALAIASLAVICSLTGCLKKDQEQPDPKTMKITVPSVSEKIRETDQYVIYGQERMTTTDGTWGKGIIIKAMKNENLIHFLRVSTNCKPVPKFTITEERFTQKNGEFIEEKPGWEPASGTFGTAENKPESDWLCLKWKKPKDADD